MIRINGDPIEWDKAVTKKVTRAPAVTERVTRVTEPVTQAEAVQPGSVCPTCGHRVPLTPAEKQRAYRARKKGGRSGLIAAVRIPGARATVGAERFALRAGTKPLAKA